MILELPSAPSSPEMTMRLELDDTILAEDNLLCAYTSKKCTNIRTTKKGGGLHRFCEFHRRRANQNQWRVDNKRRAIRAERRQLLKRARAGMIVKKPLQQPELLLTDEDLVCLRAILFDTQISTITGPHDDRMMSVDPTAFHFVC